MPDLEERVAALEATVATLTRKLLQAGDITINAARAAHGFPPFREPWADEPDFMTRTTAEALKNAGVLTIRLTHQPTGITVVARDRPEGITRLRRALTDRARRDYDLQEAERRQAAREACGDPG